MKNLILTMCLMSSVSISSVHAMENEFPGFEVRNAFKFPAKIKIQYNLPCIKEDLPSDFEPVIITLAPINENGIQEQQIVPNPKRYGFVTVEVNDGIKFYGPLDLISLITVRAGGDVFHSFNTTKDEAVPGWLYNSLTFKKFDLRGYCCTLTTKWNLLTDEQKLSPLMHIENFPSCLHSVDTTPAVGTPFSYCFPPGMKGNAIKKYTQDHPEITITQDEIGKLEADLKEKGIPLTHLHADQLVFLCIEKRHCAPPLRRFAMTTGRKKDKIK